MQTTNAQFAQTAVRHSASAAALRGFVVFAIGVFCVLGLSVVAG